MEWNIQELNVRSTPPDIPQNVPAKYLYFRYFSEREYRYWKSISGPSVPNQYTSLFRRTRRDLVQHGGCSAHVMFGASSQKGWSQMIPADFLKLSSNGNILAEKRMHHQARVVSDIVSVPADTNARSNGSMLWPPESDIGKKSEISIILRNLKKSPIFGDTEPESGCTVVVFIPDELGTQAELVCSLVWMVSGSPRNSSTWRFGILSFIV